eukprot:GHRQ01012979.1.p1 GENE.GHRQ01012979.1~~GHRQ01012979.1.p1  ORF type:complete len:390 (+),score=13.90 GHRQ01012979.1:126-1172(+)
MKRSRPPSARRSPIALSAVCETRICRVVLGHCRATQTEQECITMSALHLYVLVALTMGVHYGTLVGCDAITTNSAGERHSRSKQTLLVLCEESIQAFDLETGADLGVFLSRNSTGGRTWGLDSIAEKDGLLYIGTYFGDAALPIAFPGAVQVFTCSGRYLRRFDQGFNLKRPYGLEFISSSSASVPTDSSRHGGSARRRQQLVVSGLGNDALVLYNAKSGQHDGFLAQGDNTTASPMGPNGMLVVGRTLFLATEGSTVVSGEVVYPAYLQSALLAVDLDTKAVKLVDTPSPSPNAGYVSLLGIALLPRHADIGLSTSSSIRRGGSSSSRVMVVSDYAGGLRYYSVAPP